MIPGVEGIHKFGRGTAVEATNLIPTPSRIAGWTNTSLTTFADALSDGPIYAVGDAAGDRFARQITLAATTTYTLAAVLDVRSGAGGVHLRILAPDGSTVIATGTTRAAGFKGRDSLSFTTTSAGDYYVQVRQGGAGAAEWYSRLITLVAGSRAFLFDGDHERGQWTGTAYASTSQLLAPLIALNDKDVLPLFNVKRITGFGVGDADDNREARNGARGEVARRGQRRGKTVSYEGTLEASTLLELRQAINTFNAAFDPMTEQRMEALLHPEQIFATGLNDYSRFLHAQPLSPVITEEQDSDRFERPFAVTMRLSDPRVFWPDQEGPFQTGAFSATGQRTNLAQNPSLEADSTGWAASGVGVIANRSATGKAQVGEYEFVAVSASGGAVAGAVYALPGTAPLAASTQYTVSAYVRGEAASIGKTFKLRVRELTSGGTQVGSESEASFTMTAAKQRVSLTRTFGGTGVDVEVYVTSTTTHAVAIAVDALQIEAAASATAYFDGDDLDADWTGTAHASTSKTRVAQTVAVTNPGRTDADPVLTIHGPTGSSWAADNQTTGKRLAWEGLTLGSSDSVIVDFSDRSALMAGEDVSRYLDFSQTDWWDEGAVGLAVGLNTLALRVSEFSANTDLSVSYFPADPA